MTSQGVTVCILKITINLELIVYYYTNNIRIVQLYLTPFLACAIYVVYFTSIFIITPSICYYCFCFKHSIVLHPDQCSSVGWAPSRKVKGCWFYSLLGQMPRVKNWSLVEAHARKWIDISHVDVSFPLSLPSPFSKK
ncbi:hypothetical protein HJG60_008288 [Phyllostomus discolor]|uniref:Uncharacterized protein n=1 Tax=Phyllostomus discolor TaxID=89673 RepID=A0A833Z8W3_9CHIR|nr:hypothetical protein HJG60_008288 [Phyllostomus discolor]